MSIASAWAASIAVIFAGVFQAALLWWGARKSGAHLRLVWPRLTPDVKALVLLAIPGAIAASVTVQVVAWYLDQALLISGLEMPSLVWLPISWGHVLLLALPLGLLAFLTTTPRLRAIYRAWALAIAFIAVLAFPRALPRTASQPAALAQIVLSLLCAGVLVVVAFRLYAHAAQLASYGDVTMFLRMPKGPIGYTMAILTALGAAALVIVAIDNLKGARSPDPGADVG